ncbi:hypothetical protein BY458DRAFT_480108 [Sporodiniella umbellata]|nr:hypothetical protein BY458DRAFT_480108 [Sporodiniella umbellata]
MMNDIYQGQQNTSDGSSVRRKRARATAEQLSVLEGVFAVNISPNGKVRKQLSQQLNMTERSVQIWFQNKRAKVKTLQKKAHAQHMGFYESHMYRNKQGFPPNAVLPQFYQNSQENPINRFPPLLPPATFSSTMDSGSKTLYHRSLSHEAFSQSSFSGQGVEKETHLTSPLQKNPVQHLPQQMKSNSLFGLNQMYKTNNHSSLDKNQHLNLDGQNFFEKKETSMPLNSKNQEHHFFQKPTSASTQLSVNNYDYSFGPSSTAHYLPITSVTIGAWHRFKLHTSDLMSVYEPEPGKFVWYIIERNAHFKVEIPASSLRKIEVYEGLLPIRHASQPISYEKQSEVRFHLCQIPLFYMRSTDASNDSWVQCTDFTEKKQALQHFQHTLKGESEAIKQSLFQLAQSYGLGKLISFHQPNNFPTLADNVPAYPSPNSRYSTSLSPALKTTTDFF